MYKVYAKRIMGDQRGDLWGGLSVSRFRRGGGGNNGGTHTTSTYRNIDTDYPAYLLERPPPVKNRGYVITVGHCLATIIIVLLAIVAAIALLGLIEISEHRKAWEMMGETMVGLHSLMVDGGGIVSDAHKAWKAANGTVLLKKLLALDEYSEDGSAVPYDEDYERDHVSKPPPHHDHKKKSKEDLASGIHNALGLVGDMRRSKFFYEWSLIGYHFNKILEKPETERAVRSVMIRSSDVMDELDPKDMARIIGGMDVGPELKKALLAFAQAAIQVFGLSHHHHHHDDGDAAIDRETKEGGEASDKPPSKHKKKEAVIDRLMNALEKIAVVAGTPQAKLLLERLSKLQLQSLIDQGQRSLNATTMTVVDFNRRHMMGRVDGIMARSEEILGELEEMVGGFERQGVSITLRPPPVDPSTTVVGGGKRRRKARAITR